MSDSALAGSVKNLKAEKPSKGATGIPEEIHRRNASYLLYTLRPLGKVVVSLTDYLIRLAETFSVVSIHSSKIFTLHGRHIVNKRLVNTSDCSRCISSAFLPLINTSTAWTLHTSCINYHINYRGQVTRCILDRHRYLLFGIHPNLTPFLAYNPFPRICNGDHTDTFYTMMLLQIGRMSRACIFCNVRI